MKDLTIISLYTIQRDFISFVHRKFSKNQILLADSKDLIFFDNERVVEIGGDKTVTNPHVEYSEADNLYNIYFEGTDGASYKVTTSDFNDFSECVTAEYTKS